VGVGGDEDKDLILDRAPELAGQFERIAADYDARPGYPPWVFDVLAERCGLRPGTRVLEIGAGTGQATLPLLERGALITAVEPGRALARRLAERTAGQDISVVVTSFEEAEIPLASFDLVASATAFHWVDVSVGVDKCADALRDRGWLALWWTIWGDPDRPDPFHDALQPVLRAKAPHLLREEAGPRAYVRDLGARAAAVERSGAFGAITTDVLRWEGHHDAAALRSMFATFAAWIALSDPLRTEVLDDVERLARDEFGGTVHRPYQTRLYLAQRLET
jgi:SAM-dependent methyltransferase